MKLTDPGSVDAVFEQASTIRSSSVTDSALAILCSRTNKSWTIYSLDIISEFPSLIDVFAALA